MERKPRKPDQACSERIAAQQISPACRPPAAEPRPDRHPAHEQRQHQRLRVGRVAEKDFQVVAPDRLVDESRKPGYGQRQKKYASGIPAHVLIARHGTVSARITLVRGRGALVPPPRIPPPASPPPP